MPRSVFTVGGTVQAGTGRYLSRKVDDELLSLCQAGEFAFVLTARQMGKSSLMVRTAERLAQKGSRSVIVDLSQVGVRVTPDEWYLGILTAIEESLDLETDVYRWWEEQAHLSLTQRLTQFFRDVMLPEVPGRVIIFFDEIDSTLSLDFTDDFFAAIRYTYNARSRIPDFRRLSFVLIGVATPSELISDPTRTPFNIGHRVDLEYFTFEDALPLVEGFRRTPEEGRQILRWVLDWTGGHPYLTQRLAHAVAELSDRTFTKSAFDGVVARIFLGEKSDQDSNLRFVHDMLTLRAPDVTAVLTTYKSVLLGRTVDDRKQSQPVTHLKLSGIVRGEAGSLVIQNEIYAHVFNRPWLNRQWPEHWIRRVPPAVIGLVAASFVALILLGLTVMQSQRRSQAQQHSVELSAINEQLARAVAHEDSLNVVLTYEFRLTDSLRIVSETANTQLGAQLALTDSLRREEVSLNSRLTRQFEVTDSLLGVVRVANADILKERDESDSLRQIAESTLELAQVARRETITIALANKSVRLLNVGDPALGALLARQALWFSGGESNEFLDPIYDALRRSLNVIGQDGLTGGPSIVVRHDGGVRDVSYSPDGRWLASAGDDGRIGLASATVVPTQTSRYFEAHSGGVRSVEFSPDGSRLLSCGADGTVMVWSDFASVEPSGISLSVHDGAVWSCAMSPDGFLVASGGQGGTVRIVSMTDGDHPIIAETRLASNVRSLTFVDQIHALAVGGDEGVLVLWRYEGGPEDFIKLDTDHGRILDIAVSPLGNAIATAGNDQTVRLWPVDHTGEIGAPCLLQGHDGAVNHVTFGRDGQSVATASADRSVRIWNSCFTSTVPPIILQDHAAWVWTVDFSPDGGTLATGSEDRTARIWRTRPEEMARDICRAIGDRSLTIQEWQEHVGGDFLYDVEYSGCELADDVETISSATFNDPAPKR